MYFDLSMEQHGEKKIQHLFSEAANTKILNVY